VKTGEEGKKKKHRIEKEKFHRTAFSHIKCDIFKPASLEIRHLKGQITKTQG